MNNEHIDKLYSKDIKIIQNSNLFSFSIDSILLSDFAKVTKKKNGKIVDLCSGNGAVGLFISEKTKAHIYMIEIQKKLAEMSKRSVVLNHLEDQIDVYRMDINDVFSILSKDSIDSITCNPPYFVNIENSKKNPKTCLAIARHEILIKFDDVARIASGLLKFNGKFFCVHRSERLSELLFTLSKYNLIPKVLRFVFPKKNKSSNIVLIEAIKAGKPGGLIVKPDLIIYDEDNMYTKEIHNLLYKK